MDGRKSAVQKAKLVIHPDGTGVVTTAGWQSVFTITRISISSRIGNTPRFIHFESGAVFETRDNEQTDALFDLACSLRALSIDGRIQHFAGFLEHNRTAVLASLLGTLLVMVWFSFYGAPLFAREIAFLMPNAASRYVARDALELMDKSALVPSALTDARKKELSLLFDSLLPENRESLHYRLVFRGGGRIGANAFALPDATIVLTDELTQLAGSNDEISAVLLHEIGHVKYRHLLRQLLQQAGLAGLVTLVSGDISGASSSVVVLPSLLVQARYSRDMEWEADGYALQYMLAHHIPPRSFAKMMQHLESGKGGVNSGTISYLSSHPATEDRIKRFEEAAGNN
jgi:Zn-dependent protease with chaperone function